MATGWNDPEIDPFGLTHIAQISPRPMRVMVPVEARISPGMSASVRRSAWHDLGLTGTAQRARPSLKLEAPNWFIL